MYRRRLAVLIAALALAAPSAAFAQSAGDEQYEDPFGGDEPAQEEPTPEPAEPSGSAGTTVQATPEPAPTAAAAQAAPAQEQLPRTGSEAGWLAAGGAVLLAGGVVLRRRVS